MGACSGLTDRIFGSGSLEEMGPERAERSMIGIIQCTVGRREACAVEG